MMKKLLAYLFTATVLCWGATASASLMGDEVLLSCMQSGGSPEPACEGNGEMPAIVGADVEYPDYFNFQNSISIDISAESIWVTFDNGPYCGWFTCDGQGYLDFWLTDLDWRHADGSLMDGEIVGIDVITNMSGVLTDWGAHSVHFSLPETQVTNDMHLHIDLITRHGDVPEPETLAIFALALTGLGIFRRRKIQS
ncbi:PEP-CTERM sorting domain-containing protein [Thalassomonas sp. RHCl1]|uniref:PEP-CTERM sorting domain-containing protein n=1 Tax=Thalassomonas sp. RHCl1 TaxID=2995320 RepID=UPI00248AA458|nr:PEP-CTERM sorting domain-containing protein [Thalassomonas sp. RHCl1]